MTNPVETAIPIMHSVGDIDDFVNPPSKAVKEDEAVAALAQDPGWDIVEKKMIEEIERLKVTEKKENESFEQYGLRVYASQLCIRKLEWVIRNVRATEEAINSGAN